MHIVIHHGNTHTHIHTHTHKNLKVHLPQINSIHYEKIVTIGDTHDITGEDRITMWREGLGGREDGRCT